MTTIKTFGNLAEAAFVQSLLESRGIPAVLLDEQSFLTTPGMSGIRLQVDEADAKRALQFLAAERAPNVRPVEETGSAQQEAPRTVRWGSIYLSLGLIGVAGCVVGVVLDQFGIDSSKFWNARPTLAAVENVEADYNHDGRPDQFWTYRNNIVEDAKGDRNGDGKIDEWQTFDAEGRPATSSMDLNFDGNPDTWVAYENGNPASDKVDTDFNGRPDSFSAYEYGVLLRRDVIPNESGRILRRELYVAGVLREEWVDEDGNGTFDAKYQYDPFSTRSERLPIQHDPSDTPSERLPIR